MNQCLSFAFIFVERSEKRPFFFFQCHFRLSRLDVDEFRILIGNTTDKEWKYCLKKTRICWRDMIKGQRTLCKMLDFVIECHWEDYVCDLDQGLRLKSLTKKTKEYRCNLKAFSLAILKQISSTCSLWLHHSCSKQHAASIHNVHYTFDRFNEPRKMIQSFSATINYTVNIWSRKAIILFLCLKVHDLIYK